MRERRYICEECSYSWTTEEWGIQRENTPEDEMMDDDEAFDPNGDYDDLQAYTQSLEEVEKFEEIQNCPMCGSINIHEL